MNEQFDELARGLAQSVTRRQALRRFGGGLAGIALATLGFASSAKADPKPKTHFHCNCSVTGYGCDPTSPIYNECIIYCGTSISKHACGGGFFGLFRRLLSGVTG